MNPFAVHLRNASVLIRAWNRCVDGGYAPSVEKVSEALHGLVNLFLQGKTVFLPGEMDKLGKEIKGLVSNKVIDMSVCTDVTKKLRLE